MGQDRVSGPGHTIWRYWDEADWIDAIIRYDSYNGGEEVSPAVVVGIYVDAECGDGMGILVRKRLQDGLKDRFLVPIKRLNGLVLLALKPIEIGAADGLLEHVLKNLESRERETRSATKAVRVSATKYASEIGQQCRQAIQGGLQVETGTLSRFESLIDAPSS